jgi:hypothetical protein
VNVVQGIVAFKAFGIRCGLLTALIDWQNEGIPFYIWESTEGYADLNPDLKLRAKFYDFYLPGFHAVLPMDMKEPTYVGGYVRAIGLVELTGKVFVHANGWYRAEYCKILEVIAAVEGFSLSPVYNLHQPEYIYTPMKCKLYKEYGVQFCSIDWSQFQIYLNERLPDMLKHNKQVEEYYIKAGDVWEHTASPLKLLK